MTGNDQAYPHTRICSERGHEWQETVDGMTKREVFALTMMRQFADPYVNEQFIAKRAVALADALLAQLAEPQP